MTGDVDKEAIGKVENRNKDNYVSKKAISVFVVCKVLCILGPELIKLMGFSE